MPSRNQKKRAKQQRYQGQRPPKPPVSNRTAKVTAAAPAPATKAAGTATSPRVQPASRGLIFALVCALCVLVAGGAIAWAVIRDGSGGSQAAGGPMDDSGAPGALSRLSASSGAIMFRNVLPGDYWNQVGVVQADAPTADRNMVPLQCLRVHFDGTRGLCLAEGGGPAGTYAAYILDQDLRETGLVRLGGLPSRTRVSPDGRYGAATSFVSGHSYAEDGFSTETLLIDLQEGESIANLEDFTAYRDGEEFWNEDFNYWGMTFTPDGNGFYATLATGDETFLVRGNIEERSVEVLHENVECPSLSPDGTRIAYKKKVGGDLTGSVWQFHVLDLATMTEMPLTEMRSIDDQIMWFGNDQVLYGDGEDTWIMPADGSGEPTRYLANAISPTVIQPGSVAASSSQGDATAGVEVLTMSQADLGVEISLPEGAIAGSAVTYQITVTNHSDTIATGITLHHTVPLDASIGEVAAVDPPGLAYGCSSYPDEHRVRCTTPEIAPGASWTTSVTVTPASNGVKPISASVGADSNDPNPDNDRISTDLTVGT